MSAGTPVVPPPPEAARRLAPRGSSATGCRRFR